MWMARAKYEDGTELEKSFPYTANGNYSKECEEQYAIECWLLERETESPITWYSVDYIEE
jgi:hypothetical protein